MAESIKQRLAVLPDELTTREIRELFESILTDLTALRTALNAHTHGGVTVGAGSTGVADADAMGTLNTQA